MMRCVFLGMLSLLLVGCGASGPASGAFDPEFDPRNYESVTVVLVDLTKEPISSGQLDVIDTSISSAFMQRGYSVVSLNDMPYVIKTTEDLNSFSEEAVEFARQLKSPAVVLVKINELTTYEKPRRKGEMIAEARLTGRLIDVDSAIVLWIDSSMASVPVRRRDDTANLYETVAMSLAGSVPPRARTSKTRMRLSGW